MKEAGNLAANHPQDTSKRVMQAVLVAALGYFVDIYDLVLFSIVRVSSEQRGSNNYHKKGKDGSAQSRIQLDIDY